MLALFRPFWRLETLFGALVPMPKMRMDRASRTEYIRRAPSPIRCHCSISSIERAMATQLQSYAETFQQAFQQAESELLWLSRPLTDDQFNGKPDDTSWRTSRQQQGSMPAQAKPIGGKPIERKPTVQSLESSPRPAVIPDPGATRAPFVLELPRTHRRPLGSCRAAVSPDRSGRALCRRAC